MVQPVKMLAEQVKILRGKKILSLIINFPVLSAMHVR